jgi:F-type H+-transporting ATPase subunit epsilon
MAFEGEARSVLAPGTDGYFEVLIGHVPMLTSLRPGILTIRNDDGRTQYTVSGGFVEVLRSQVTVLAETIEEVGAIDLDRARQAEERARGRLESAEEGVDVERAKASLDRALNRITARAGLQ